MKPILYILTEKGIKKSFKEDFFTFFPEEVKIVHLLKLRPMNINMIKDRMNRLREDEFNRKIGVNQFGEKVHKSYDFFRTKVNFLIKIGFIKKK